MFTVLIGLLSAVFYAFHDLLAQRVSRLAGLIRVLCWVIPTGVVILVPTALLVDGLPATGAQWRAVAYCAAAGAFYLATWFAILRALQVGDLSLVAPLASLEGFFIAVFALLKGETFTSLMGLGIALAVLGGTLAAVQGRARSAAGAGWALLTGVLWATAIIFFDQAGELSWLSQAAWSRITSLILFVPVAVWALARAQGPGQTRGPRNVLGRKGAAICVGAGVLEVLGLVAMTLAVKRGPLAVAGVTVSQYATVAVILGLVLLKERPRPHQVAGVICTIAAVTILSVVG